MAHFAKCKLQEDGKYKVVRVNYGRDEDSETDLDSRETEEGVIWRKTSYGTRAGAHYSKNEFSEWRVDRNEDGSYDRSRAYRKNYAGIGYIYDPELDAFYPEKPHASWTLNNSSCIWESPLGPKPQPTADMISNNQHYEWNEEAYQNDTNDPKTEGWDIVVIPSS